MITNFNISQLDEVMSIWLKTNISAHNFIAPKYWNDAFDEVKNALPLSDIYVYQDDGTIKGFIGIMDHQYIAGLFVLEEYQSQGIGKKLIDHCKQRYQSLELDVFVENDGAVKFYKRHGFVVETEERNPDFGRMEYHMTNRYPIKE